ncbi:MAG TPA: ABC transporter permease [Nitrososphaerales archaeon]|nr:ABC transporter permease [Nitrososphaerales archaeon]
MGLGRYVARKTIYTVVLLLIIVAFNFVLFQILPFVTACPSISIADCASRLYAPQQPPRGVQNASLWFTTIRLKIIHSYGFDQPLYIRFLDYYRNMFTFNFGYNLGNILGGSVYDTIASRTPYTLLLLGSSTVASFVVGIGLGVVASAKRGRLFDISSLAALLFLNSLPVFFLGSMLKIAELGTTGSYYISWETATISQQGWAVYVTTLQALFLPFLTLTMAGIGGVFLTQRAVMIDTLAEDYIVMARAKGVPESTVLYKHALRNAVLPIVTAFALSIGFILSGAIITETVFQWNGLGYAIFQAISNNDFPFAQAMFFIISVMVLIALFAAELSYGVLDPRVSRG